MNPEKLIQRIKIVFGSVSRPEYITKRPLLKEVPYVVEIEERFKNRTRDNLSFEDVGWLISDIIWLSDEALQFFFPKILEVTILHPFKLLNFDLLPMQLADKKTLKEKFGFIIIAQAELILEILQFWSRNEELMKRWSVTEDLENAIIYWKKRDKK